MQKNNILNVLHETLLAEHGSALEMLAACKKSKKATHVFGYFEHAKDEYIHTKAFRELLSKRTRLLSSSIARKYRFNSLGLIKKGYVARQGFLIETMKVKDFIAYVYTNELLAKESFNKILMLIESFPEDCQVITDIMNDELRHHGLAKEHFLRYYPSLQPWQLRLYKFRETINNKTRKLYHKNLKFLEKIFLPLYSIFSVVISILFNYLNLHQFNRLDSNLMDISPKSML